RPLAHLDAATIVQIEKRMRAYAPPPEKARAHRSTANGRDRDFESATRADIEEAVDFVENRDLDWMQWTKGLFAIYAALGPGAWRDPAHRFSKRSKKYDAAYTDERLDEIERSPPKMYTDEKSVLWWAWRNPAYEELQKQRSKEKREKERKAA